MPPAVFQKNRATAISLAVQGLSYAHAGKWVGCVKSTVCQWLWCVFHLLREYRRNIGEAGYAAARRLLNAGSLAEAKGWVCGTSIA